MKVTTYNMQLQSHKLESAAPNDDIQQEITKATMAIVIG